MEIDAFHHKKARIIVGISRNTQAETSGCLSFEGMNVTGDSCVGNFGLSVSTRRLPPCGMDGSPRMRGGAVGALARSLPVSGLSIAHRQRGIRPRRGVSFSRERGTPTSARDARRRDPAPSAPPGHGLPEKAYLLVRHGLTLFGSWSLRQTRSGSVAARTTLASDVQRFSRHRLA